MEVKVNRISVEMSCFACKIQSCFTLFLFFLNIGVRCPSHNWSKISSNRADFSHAHRGVNGVPGDVQWVHLVKGFRSYGTLNLKNIFKFSPC